MDAIPEGALVSYAGCLLYFGAHGPDGCYLYKRREDVGRRALAVFQPHRAYVTWPADARARPCPAELQPIRPTQYEIEQEEAYFRRRDAALRGEGEDVSGHSC